MTPAPQAVAPNAVVGLIARARDLYVGGEFDGLREVFASEMVREDRRALAAQSELDGLESILAIQQVAADSGRDSFDFDVVATRGDRLALLDLALHTDLGDDRVLGLVEAGPSLDHVISYVVYGPDQLAKAAVELDRRYLATLSPELAAAYRAPAAFNHARNPGGSANDVDALLAPDYEMIDHRSFGWPTMDRSTVMDRFLSSDDTGWVGFAREILAHDEHGTVAVIDVTTTSPPSHRVFPVVQTVVDGLIARSETFAEGDEQAALARFAELAAAAPPAPPSVNACAQAMVEMERRYAAQDWEGLSALMSPDVVMVSHMSGPSSRHQVGRDEAVDGLRSRFGVGFQPVPMELQEVRGDRHALAVFKWVTDDGLVSDRFGVAALGLDGLLEEAHTFDIEDRAGAVAMLNMLWQSDSGSEPHARVPAGDPNTPMERTHRLEDGSAETRQVDVSADASAETLERGTGHGVAAETGAQPESTSGLDSLLSNDAVETIERFADYWETQDWEAMESMVAPEICGDRSPPWAGHRRQSRDLEHRPWDARAVRGRLPRLHTPDRRYPWTRSCPLPLHVRHRRWMGRPDACDRTCRRAGSWAAPGHVRRRRRSSGNAGAHWAVDRLVGRG